MESESRADFYRRTMEEIQGDLDSAREHNAWTALANLHRQLRDARDSYDEASKAEGSSDPLAEMTEEEVLAHIEDECRGWAPTHQRVVVDVYLEQHRMPTLEALMEVYREARGHLVVVAGSEG